MAKMPRAPLVSPILRDLSGIERAKALLAGRKSAQEATSGCLLGSVRGQESGG